jgi:hypothetical protein
MTGLIGLGVVAYLVGLGYILGYILGQNNGVRKGRELGIAEEKVTPLR